MSLTSFINPYKCISVSVRKVLLLPTSYNIIFTCVFNIDLYTVSQRSDPVMWLNTVLKRFEKDQFLNVYFELVDMVNELKFHNN